MAQCRNETILSGAGIWPKSCHECGLGPCKNGITDPFKPQATEALCSEQPPARHPHADVMIAYAINPTLLIEARHNKKHEWAHVVNPSFEPKMQYRIKPSSVHDCKDVGDAAKFYRDTHRNKQYHASWEDVETAFVDGAAWMLNFRKD